MIHGKQFFGQSIENNLRTNNNIQKVSTGQEDDYTMAVRNLSLFLEITIRL